MGCIGHPNVKGQKAIAEAIYPMVKDILEKVEKETTQQLNLMS